MKGTLEQAVKALQFQRLDIVQPSLLIRPNSDRLGERWSEKLLKLLNGVGLLKAYQPIKVQDLGFLMHQMVFNKTAGVYVWTLKDLLKNFKIIISVFNMLYRRFSAPNYRNNVKLTL